MDQIFKARWIFLLTRIWPLLWSILNVYISARLLGELKKSLLNSLFYWEHLLSLICFKECYLNECQCSGKGGWSYNHSNILGQKCQHASHYSRHHLMQVWPTFLGKWAKFKIKKWRGPKSGSKGPWRAKFLAVLNVTYVQICCLSQPKSLQGPFQKPWRAKNGPRAPRWPPLT
jgi:hypothetical protein